MLSIYRRHGPGCKRGLNQGRRYRACKCTVWIEGKVAGRNLPRQSLKTRSWAEAEERRRKLEAQEFGERAVPIALEEATRQFLADCNRRKLARETLRKHHQLMRDLQLFARQIGVRELRSLQSDDASLFVESWKIAPNTAAKRLERLKTFFRYSEQRGWISANPTRFIRPPKVKLRQTLPFSDEEMRRILETCEGYRDEYGRISWNARQVRAFVLLMRYSGLRIGDAARLAQDRIDSTGRLFLYTSKAGTPVSIVLPEPVTRALQEFPHANEHYFFWSGSSDPDGAARTWMNRLSRIFRTAGIKGCGMHP